MNRSKAAEMHYSEIEVFKQKWSAGDRYCYEQIKRPSWGICFVLSGKITYICENKIISAQNESAVILKKGSYYRAEFPIETQCILINFQASGSFAEDESESIIVKEAKPELKNDFTDILNYSVFDSRKCMVKSVFYRLLDKIGENNKETVLSSEIQRLLEADADFSLRESEIAARCAVSVSTAQRSFFKAYGKTISAYRTELRMARAKNLLSAGLYSVEQVSEMLGFCDCAYFSKSFKKAVGLSPSRFIRHSNSM